MTEQTQPLTFNDLCDRQPQLLALWILAATDPTTDTLGAWFGPSGYKQRLCDLVGWFSSTTDTVLTSPESYTIAYNEILGQLERYKGKGRK